MARNNTLSASFSQAAGDGATGFSESSGSLNFTSGDAIKIEGSVSTEIEHAVANYGMAQADGIYFENRDSSNLMILTLRTATGSGNNLCALKIAPNGIFCIRFDATQTPITHIAVECGSDSAYVLCLAE